MIRLPLPEGPLPAEVVASLREADVPDETIYLGQELASWAVDLPPRDRRALAELAIALLERRADGSTRRCLDDAEAALLASPALASLVGAPGDYRPLIVEGGFLYTHRDRLLEERLAASLAARLARPDTRLEPAALDAAVVAAAPPGRRWSAEQEAALRAALVRPLTVVTGGPGTGKTALIAGMVRALARLGVPAEDIALAAPTGKAANRIAESLEGALEGAPAPAPQTLHRLLGFHGGRPRPDGHEFRHHENHRLPHRVVLVDETSMVDLALMERLARAARDDARLVLLGDADQLPSVEAGAVFRDLGAWALALTESHRMRPADPAGAEVLAAARAVKAGRAADLPPAHEAAPRTLSAVLRFSGFEQVEAAGPAPAADRRLVGAFLDLWYATRVRALPGHDALAGRTYRLRDGRLDEDEAPALGALLAHHGSLRILAVTRGPFAATGADAVNAALARRAAADAGARAAGRAPGEPSPGTPVLMTRNDYQRGLYNGDQGVIVRAAEGGARPRLVAVFPRPGGLAPFPFEGLRHDLAVAYATTVHKAQGAELEHAALILPERDLPLTSRELLYTALTRARRSVVVVGRRALLERAAARPLERASGLAERLATFLDPR